MTILVPHTHHKTGHQEMFQLEDEDQDQDQDEDVDQEGEELPSFPKGALPAPN